MFRASGFGLGVSGFQRSGVSDPGLQRHFHAVLQDRDLHARYLAHVRSATRSCGPHAVCPPEPHLHKHRAPPYPVPRAGQQRHLHAVLQDCDLHVRYCVQALLFYDGVKSCRPVIFTDSKTQPSHESPPPPWTSAKRTSTGPLRLAKGGALPCEGPGHCPGFSRHFHAVLQHRDLQRETSLLTTYWSEST